MREATHRAKAAESSFSNLRRISLNRTPSRHIRLTLAELMCDSQLLCDLCVRDGLLSPPCRPAHRNHHRAVDDEQGFQFWPVFPSPWWPLCSLCRRVSRDSVLLPGKGRMEVSDDPRAAISLTLSTHNDARAAASEVFWLANNESHRRRCATYPTVDGGEEEKTGAASDPWENLPSTRNWSHYI